MQSKRQFIAPVTILIGACLIMAFYVYDARTKQHRPFIESPTTNTDTFVGNDGDDAPPTIEKRAAQVLWVWHDIATSSLINTGDVNSIYRIWSSQMVKRGVPDIYINRHMYDTLSVLTIADQLTPQQVIHAITPTYQQELQQRSQPKHIPVPHICSN
jgi:hypothetical protein